MAVTNNSNPASGGGQPLIVPPIHPFFAVPGLSADGDFEVLETNVHHSPLPREGAFFALPDISANSDFGEMGGTATPFPLSSPIQPFDYTDSDAGTYQFRDETGSDNKYGGPSDSFVGGGGPPPKGDSDNGKGGDNHGGKFDGGDNSGDWDEGFGRDHQGKQSDGSDRSGDDDNGAGGDHRGKTSDGADNSGDGDNGAGGDERGLKADGGDNSGDSDSFFGGGGDHQGQHNDGSDRTGDADNGKGGDHQGYYHDGTDRSGDFDDASGLAADHGGLNGDGADNKDSDGGKGGDHGGTSVDGRDSSGDSDNGAGRDTGKKDGADTFTPVLFVDSDSAGCDSSMLLLNYPPPLGDVFAAAGIATVMVIIATIPDLLLLPFFGEAIAENAIIQVDSILERLLTFLGVDEGLALAIRKVLNLIGVPTSPLDILNAGQRAASTLQPILTNLQNKNTMSSLKRLIAENNGCLPPSCYNKFTSIIAGDGTLFTICDDGLGGTDNGDHQSGGKDHYHILGIAAKNNFVPLTNLEIPNLISFSNNGSFSLNPFASAPALDASNLIPDKS